MVVECLKINDLILLVYKDFGFDEIVVKFFMCFEKCVGFDENWDYVEIIMFDVLKQIEEQLDGCVKIDVLLGEGVFYGLKFEYMLCDVIGCEW